MSAADKYWITTSGTKSFAVMHTMGNGMTVRVGIYRSRKKAQAVRQSLINPIPYITP